MTMVGAIRAKRNSNEAGNLLRGGLLRVCAAGLIAASLVLAGCTTGSQRVPQPQPSPQRETKAEVIHVVAQGQTLWRIARVYGVPMEIIARANGITDPTRIRVGRRLVIPGASRVLEVPPAPQPLPPIETPPPGDHREPPPETSASWSWPLEGPISSRFGASRSHGRHQGVDITAPEGSSVRAARDGRVVFAGRRGAYGRLVVLEHSGGFSSWYAHNRTLRVRTGQWVQRGTVIARSGHSGNATGPHLHFEIRRQGKPLDPLLLIP